MVNILLLYKMIYDEYLQLNGEEEIKKLKKKYKIFEVNRLDKNLINNMLDYYINNKDCKIYEKTDYLCNEKNKICICNINANNLRKIYNDNNYKEENKYISWLKVSKYKSL